MRSWFADRGTGLGADRRGGSHEIEIPKEATLIAAGRDASSEMTRQRDAVSIEREHTAHTGPSQSSPLCS
jgi:hypothetical protein